MTKMKDRTRNFYFYSLFGVPFDKVAELEVKGKIILCAHKAYGDLSRTIGYCLSTNEIEKKKKDPEVQKYNNQKNMFKNEVCEYIGGQISVLLENVRGKGCTEFDTWHSEICNEIIKKAKDKEGLVKDFNYGQAQKWVNMTIKYMDVTGLWDDCEAYKHLRTICHIPVDSYILEAASDEGIVAPYKNGEMGSYKESKSLKWSQWQEEHYKMFIGIPYDKNGNYKQKCLRSIPKSLPDWEDEKWIEYAHKNSNKNSPKK